MLESRDVAVSTLEDTPIIVQVPVFGTRKAQAMITTPPAHGTLLERASSEWVYTPNENYVGPDLIAVTFDDGLSTVVGTANITITPVNDLPVANGDSFAAGFAVALTVQSAILIENDTDIDGPSLSVTGVVNGTHGTVAMAGGNVVFTPETGFQGAATFSYRVSDGMLDALGTVTVAVGANGAPVATNDTGTTAEDTAVQLARTTLFANDSDPDQQTLSISGVGNGLHGTPTVTATGVAFTPDLNYFGVASFDYTITDGSATDVGTVTVTVSPVNDAPVAANDVDVATEDEMLVISAATLIGNDIDVDGNPLTITAVSGATNGTVAMLTGVTSAVAFTPTANFVGAAGFDYTISDGTTTSTGHVNVQVGAVNDPPTLVTDARTSPEDVVFVIAAADLLANDTDVDGDTMTFTGVGSPSNGTLSAAGGVITFTPTPNYSGPAGFTYTATDGTLPATGTVAITITPVNDAPLAVDDTATTAEDVAVMLSPLVNDLDIDGDTLSVSTFTQGANGVVTFVGNVATYTPAANYAGLDSFTYTANDGAGGTSVATVRITITPVNDAPSVANDVLTVQEDTSGTIDVRLNDSDDGGTLTVIGVSAPAHGVASIVGGIVSYAPALNYNGPDSFQYAVADSDGLQSTAIVTVTVVPVNDAPLAVDDAYAVNDNLIQGVIGGLLTNDSDVDSPAFTAVLEVGPEFGTLVLNPDGSFTYFPDDVCAEFDYFSYRATDGVGLSNIATVALHINHSPVAYPGFYTTSNYNPIPTDCPFDGYLSYDDIDADDQLTVQLVSGPSNAAVFSIDQLLGTFHYESNPGYVGPDSFAFQVWDGSVWSSPATVMIDVVDSQYCGGDKLSTFSFTQVLQDEPSAIAEAVRCCYYAAAAPPGQSSTVIGGSCQIESEYTLSASVVTSDN